MTSAAAEKDYYHDQLRNQGFVSVPLGLSGADINPLFSQFQSFLNLCDEPGGSQFRDALAVTPPRS